MPDRPGIQTHRNLAAGLGLEILLLDQGLLDGIDAVEVDRARAVLADDSSVGRVGGSDALGEKFCPLLGTVDFNRVDTIEQTLVQQQDLQAQARSQIAVV